MNELNPSEKFAKHSKRATHPLTSDFESSQFFEFDDFQIRGCHSLEDGDSVLIAAPTGSGKTILGQFAIFLGLKKSKKVFYTTPIKALSNQKYQDFAALYGEENIGLLTGDNSINSDAPILIMTTEILRNMLYAGSHTLANLGYVIMDEVHYLADRFRGAVWEETLIHLPESVQVVSLSATVSNAEEFGEWLQSIRGNTKVIVTDKRPVPLFQYVYIGNSFLDLFTDDGKVNPEVLREERANFRTYRGARFNKNNSGSVISKSDLIEKLEREKFLPLIYFIFSRKGCDFAVKQCLKANLKLTSKNERDQIVELLNKVAQQLDPKDLAILEFQEWSEALSRGFAAHHAGLLPIFKETVEELFQNNLLKVVFATETLALGINMPAKTVLLDRLSKWNGESHVNVTPGEYTQLTGRAGRRGLDSFGNAIILWSQEIDAHFAASLANTRTYPLRSSFKPTYNMSINLVGQMGKSRAKNSLSASFAQFQADKAVVNLEIQKKRNLQALEALSIEMQCNSGDFLNYATIKNELRDEEKDLKNKSGRKRISVEERIVNLRSQMKKHPVHSCPDRDEHARLGEKYFRISRENDGITNRINARTNVIPRQFDSVTKILERRGYLKDEQVFGDGKKLSKIYSEFDLLICEVLKKDIFSRLSPAEISSLFSIFVFDSRKETTPKIPNGALQDSLSEIAKIWLSIHEDELEYGLDETKQIDLGFMWSVFQWAKTKSLSGILQDSDLTVGDFIRSMRQLIDLLRQIIAVYPEHSEQFSSALKAIDRGIVSFVGIA